MSLFIAEAHANTPAAAPGPDAGMANLVMLVLFFVVFYFLLWRPQSKRAKEHKALMTALKAGDEIVFAGGLLGRIQKVDDEYAVVDLGEKVTLRIQKASVIASLPAGTLKNIGQNKE